MRKLILLITIITLSNLANAQEKKGVISNEDIKKYPLITEGLLNNDSPYMSLNRVEETINCEEALETIKEGFEKYNSYKDMCWIVYRLVPFGNPISGLRNKPGHAHSGEQYIMHYSFGYSEGDVYFITPRLSTINSNYKASFWFKDDNADSELTMGTMKMDPVKKAPIITSFKPFGKSHTISTEVYQEYVSEPAPNDDAQYFAIKVLNTSAHQHFTLDDFKWERISTASIMEDEFTNEIKLYPNPISNNVLKIDNLDNFNVAILNTEGREVLKNKNTRRNQEIDLSILPSGVYFVKIQKENKLTVKRIVLK